MSAKQKAANGGRARPGRSRVVEDALSPPPAGASLRAGVASKISVALRLGALAALALAIALPTGREFAATLAGIGVCSASGLLLDQSRFRRYALWPPLLCLAWGCFSYAAAPLARSAGFSLGVIAAAPLGMLIACLPHMQQLSYCRNLGRACWLTCVLIAGTLGAEMLAREYEPRSFYEVRSNAGSAVAQLYRTDALLGHRMQSHFRGQFVHPEYCGESFTTNAAGYRDAEWVAAAAGEGERPILLLGDSMVLGLGVEREDALPALLENELRTRSGSGKLIVRNTAVAGYGPGHHRLVLEEVLPVLQPRLVVLCFYDGNDLEDEAQLAARSTRSRTEPQEPEAQDHPAPAPALWTRRYWYRASHLFRICEMALAPRFARWGIAPPDWIFNPEFLHSMALRPDAEVRRRFGLVEASLNASAALCASHGARFVLVRLPAKLQVERGSCAELLRSLGRDPAQFDSALPGQAVLRWAAAGGNAAVDLLPVLAHPRMHGSPHYFFEGHLSRAGHRAVAAHLAERILEL